MVDILFAILVALFIVPILLCMWINCVDFSIDKFKEWF